MRLAALFSLLIFSFSAHAVIDTSVTRRPLLSCIGSGLMVQIDSHENQKEARMVVRDAVSGGQNIIYSSTVQPVETDPEQIQLYLSKEVSLRVIPNNGILKGFLNLHGDRPSVAQVVNCQTYFHIQSVME
ncbi:MAG: hypothetical protein KF802_13740 [Bdellovibrionaceae bacterium]|nr:hypothetical protein [Pseudobdellovibrionaceae bacterium]MBX3033090.1 hypothetical protein [Pseudobdellovibrionaceae bacterium]